MTVSSVTQPLSTASQHKTQNAALKQQQRDPDHDGDIDPAGVPDAEKSAASHAASHHAVNLKA